MISRDTFIKCVVKVISKHLKKNLPKELPESEMVTEAMRLVNEEFHHIIYAIKEAIREER